MGTELEKKLESGLRYYKNQIKTILSEEDTKTFCKLFISYEYGKRLLNATNLEIKDLDNQIEVAAAKQLPKDTEYNIIGVVNQYITALRSFTEEKDLTKKLGLENRVKLCAQSIIDNYGEEKARNIISIAMQKSVVLAQFESLKNSCDVEYDRILAMSKYKKGLKVIGKLYAETYAQLDDERKKQIHCSCLKGKSK